MTGSVDPGALILFLTIYTILLVMIASLPWLTYMSGLPYLAGVTMLNIGFLWYALRMLRHHDDEQLPMQTFRYSVLYLMTLFALLTADHYFLLTLPNGA